MKKYLSFVVACLIFATISWVASVWGDYCRQPNPNTKACASPQNDISSCEFKTSNPEDCLGKALYMTPPQFPNGTVGTPKGSTATERKECLKKVDCEYSVSQKACYGTREDILWDNIPATMEDKIVVGENQCPLE